MWTAPASPSEDATTTKVMAVLDRYFAALQDGTAAHLYSTPGYVWRFYNGEMTVERLRQGLAGIDEYLWAEGQRYHVAREHRDTAGNTATYDAGPELSRLPDHALYALFEEMDGILAAGGLVVSPASEACL